MKTVMQNFQNGKSIFPGTAIPFVFISVIMLMVQSCATINPGEVGLKIKRGKMEAQNYVPGRYHPAPGTKFVRFSTRIKEVSLQSALPTKEGLEAKINLTMLYHIKPEEIQSVYLRFGMDYEKELVMNNLEAIARETCLNYRAMDLMIQRDSLEKSIRENMNTDLAHYGFVMDQILVQYIDVPKEIDAAIEKKVLSEQEIKQQEVNILTQKKSTDASIEKERKEMEFDFEKQNREMETTIQQQRMQADFAIEKEKKEAERKVIEATAAKKVQDLQNSTITPLLIKYKTIDVMAALANSPNTKLIITDGKTPLTLRDDGKY